MAKRLALSGMVVKLTANTTSAARPHSISKISNTPAKIAIVPRVGRQASNDARSDGRWLWVCMALLASYKPRHKNGPISKKPALSAKTYSGAL